MSTTEVEVLRPPLTEQEARKITEKIRKGAENLRDLLVEAHERQAWKALGHSGWATYLAEEFDMSATGANRLLRQAKAIKEIVAVTGLSAEKVEAAVSARAADELGPEGVAAVGKEVGEKPWRERAQALKDSVASNRAEREKDEPVDGDRARSAATSPDANDGGENGHTAQATFASPEKLEQAAKAVQQLVEIDPQQVAETYLAISPDVRRVSQDELPRRLMVWASDFAKFIGADGQANEAAMAAADDGNPF